MPRTHLFVAQEVLLDSGDGGEDFGVLVAPVRLEVFDARLRLAMDEDLSGKLDLCDSWAWWAGSSLCAGGNNASHSRKCKVQSGDYDCYAGQIPLLPSNGLHRGFT